MANSVFVIIMNYAIDREYESERLYHEMAHRPSLRKYANFLNEMAEDEIIHARELENLRLENQNISLPKKLIDTHQIVATPPVICLEDFDKVRTFLQYIAKEEENICKLYHDIAKHVKDNKIKNVFLRLAQQEKEHNKRLRDHLKKALDKKI